VTGVGRAFVAVVPPADVLDAIEARVAPLRRDDAWLRWSGREQWHVTLRFLGRVDDVGALVEALRTAVASVGTVDGVQLSGGGAVPDAGRASVLWVGVGSGGDALAGLAGIVESAVVGAGFAAERRAFHPHLTVARAAGPRDLRRLVEAIGDEPVGSPWPVADVAVMASDTRPDGAVYTEIARIGLGGGGRA